MSILCTALQLYLLIIFARVILSWFPSSGSGVLESVNDFLYMLTEPVLGPLRRAIPPVRMGGMGLDLSPLIVLLVIELVISPIVCR